MTIIGERLDKLIKEREHDTYKTKGKLSEPTVCPVCGAVYHKGHWQWMDAPAGAEEHKCPACQRIEDKVPAGYVNISGEFFNAHRDEIMGLIHNQEQREKTGHPLNRLMAITDTEDGIEITTTDMHLPRDIGVALEKAYDGELDFQYTDESNILRVTWSR
jgi:hypothetical protein